MEEFGGVLSAARAWATWHTMGTCCATEGANPLSLDFSELGTQKTPIQKTELRAAAKDAVLKEHKEKGATVVGVKEARLRPASPTKPFRVRYRKD